MVFLNAQLRMPLKSLHGLTKARDLYTPFHPRNKHIIALKRNRLNFVPYLRCVFLYVGIKLLSIIMMSLVLQRLGISELTRWKLIKIFPLFSLTYNVSERYASLLGKP